MLFSTLCIAAEPEQSSAEAELQRIITTADSLYNSHKYDELLAFMKEHADSDNDEVLWRLARALNEKSKVTDDKAQKKQLLREAFEVVKRALALNDQNFACHKVCMKWVRCRLTLALQNRNFACYNMSLTKELGFRLECDVYSCFTISFERGRMRESAVRVQTVPQ